MTTDRSISFKVDVCTHDGMRLGVPRLLEHFERLEVRASFFLSFGPDNSGKALLNAWKPSFVKKMLKSSAGSLYGWRTMLSGTLLPARPIASAFPKLVQEIERAGHEVAVHAWDHRRWQDHVFEMRDEEIRRHYESAIASYQSALGHRPSACGAAAWIVSERSLAIQDSLGLSYASDLRGGVPCRLRSGSKIFATPQIPTTGRCVEELLTQGLRGEQELADALVLDLAPVDRAVLAVHAEVEGGPFARVLDLALPRLVERFGAPRRLDEVARELAAKELPTRVLAYTPLAGRSGQVTTSRESLHA